MIRKALLMMVLVLAGCSDPSVGVIQRLQAQLQKQEQELKACQDNLAKNDVAAQQARAEAQAKAEEEQRRIVLEAQEAWLKQAREIFATPATIVDPPLANALPFKGQKTTARQFDYSQDGASLDFPLTPSNVLRLALHGVKTSSGPSDLVANGMVNEPFGPVLRGALIELLNQIAQSPKMLRIAGPWAIEQSMAEGVLDLGTTMKIREHLRGLWSASTLDMAALKSRYEWDDENPDSGNKNFVEPANNDAEAFRAYLYRRWKAVGGDKKGNILLRIQQELIVQAATALQMDEAEEWAKKLASAGNKKYTDPDAVIASE